MNSLFKTFLFLLWVPAIFNQQETDIEQQENTYIYIVLFFMRSFLTYLVVVHETIYM